MPSVDVGPVVTNPNCGAAPIGRQVKKVRRFSTTSSTVMASPWPEEIAQLHRRRPFDDMVLFWTGDLPIEAERRDELELGAQPEATMPRREQRRITTDTQIRPIDPRLPGADGSLLPG
jgi:hypothetical protein